MYIYFKPYGLLKRSKEKLYTLTNGASEGTGCRLCPTGTHHCTSSFRVYCRGGRNNGTSFRPHPPPKVTKIRGPGRLALGCGPPASCGSTSGQREADVRRAPRRVLTLRAPSRLGHIATLEDQSSARLQAAGCSLLATWTGADNAVVFPRPGQTGPLPRRKATGYTATLKDSIGLNPHPKMLHDYRSCPKSTVVPTCVVVNYLRT